MALKIGAKSPSNEGKNRKFFRTGVKAITWWEEDKEGLEEHTEWREEGILAFFDGVVGSASWVFTPPSRPRVDGVQAII